MVVADSWIMGIWVGEVVCTVSPTQFLVKVPVPGHQPNSTQLRSDELNSFPLKLNSTFRTYLAR